MYIPFHWYKLCKYAIRANICGFCTILLVHNPPPHKKKESDITNSAHTKQKKTMPHHNNSNNNNNNNNSADFHLTTDPNSELVLSLLPGQMAHAAVWFIDYDESPSGYYFPSGVLRYKL